MAASTEEIVTRFTADLTDLEQGIAKAGASLKKYEDYAGGAAASGNQLNSNLGSLTAKTMALEGVQKRVVAGTKEEASALGTVATSMRVVSNEQSKLGNTKGFDAAGKAADEEAQKIAALIERITQLKAAHASAGTIEAKGPIAADIGTAQAELSAIPIPQGAQNTAEIASALAPLQAVQQQAVVTAAEVDKAANDINADITRIGTGGGPALKVFDDLEAKAAEITGKLGVLTDAETTAVTGAKGIVAEYRNISTEGQKFPGQLQQLQAQAEASLGTLSAIADEEERASRAAQLRSNRLSNAKAILEAKDLTDAQKEAAAQTAGLSDEYAELRKQAGSAGGVIVDEGKKQAGILTLLREKIDALNAKKLTLTNPGEIAKVNAELHRLTKEYEGLATALPKVKGAGGSLGNITGPLKELGGKATGLIGRLTSGLGGIGELFTSLTGPIGIAAAAVGGFFANMLRLDSVQVSIEGIKKGFGGFLDQLAAGKFSISAIIDSFREGKKLAEELDALQDRRAARQLSSADEVAQVESLLRLAKDRTKTEEQRIELLKKAQQINSAGAAQEVKLAQDEARAALDEFKRKLLDQNNLDIQSQNIIKGIVEVDPVFLEAQLQNLKQFTGKAIEVDDEARQAAVDAQAKVIDARRSAAAVEETAQNRINFLVEEGAAQRTAAAQKAAEAAKKLAEQSAANAQQRAEAERQVTEIVTGLQDQELRTGLSAREQQAFDIDKKYDDLVIKATDSFAKLRKLAGEGTPGADTAAIASINAKQKEVNAQINAARDSEQTTATQKATADEIKVRQDGQNQVLGIIDQGNKRELDALRSKLSSGIALTGTEQANFLDLIARVNEAEIKAAQDKYAKLLEDNRKYNSDALGLTEQGKANEADLVAQRDADINAANLAAQEARNAQTYASMVAQNEILASSAEQGVALLVQAGLEGQLQSEQFAKQFVLLMLDTLEKLVLMNAVGAATGAIAGNAAAGPTGVAKGIIEAALVTALIKGMFAAIKGTIQGAYTGEDYIGGTPTWSGKDGHLRRVHTGERIVTAKTNAEHFDLFQAAEGGVLHDYLSANYVLPAINNYLESDDGRRVSTSIMVPKYHDANVVRGLKTAADKTDRTNELLYALLKKEPRVVTQSRRSWN